MSNDRPVCDDVTMEISITDDARKVLEKKGGTMSIDFIRPTG